VGFVKQICEKLSYVYGLWSLVFLKDVLLLSELTVVPYTCVVHVSSTMSFIHRIKWSSGPFMFAC
jgi:hypothetical protein